MVKIAAVMISTENKCPLLIEHISLEKLPRPERKRSGQLDRVRPAGQNSHNDIHTGLGLAFSKTGFDIEHGAIKKKNARVGSLERHDVY